MDDSTWVEAMARLYVAPRELEAAGRGAVGPGAEDSARAAVLAELGIAPDSLLRFAEAAGADPARMASLWEAVAARVEELGGPPAEAARRAGRGAPRETGGAAPAPHRAAPPPGAAPRRQIVTPEPEPGVRPPPGRRAPAAVPGDAGARPGERAPAGEARPRPARMPAATERDTSDLQERLRRVRERAAADSA